MTFSRSYIKLFRQLQKEIQKYKTKYQVFAAPDNRQIRVYMGNQPSIMQGTESG
jgi:hypothetical protein